MNKMIKLAIASIATAVFFAIVASPGKTESCGYSQVDYNPDPNIILTQEETIAEMDLAFQNSLSSYNECLQQRPEGGNSGQVVVASADPNDGYVESLPVRGISGTEKPVDTYEPPVQAQAVPNGAIPKDIPSAEYDTAFQAQVRGIAIAETDPVYRNLLWNEYRKSKGLPQVR